MEWAKGGYEDAVGKVPVLLAMVGSEQTIVNASTKLVQRRRDGFVEAFLIANLVEQSD